jgi:hypothetical protein
MQYNLGDLSTDPTLDTCQVNSIWNIIYFKSMIELFIEKVFFLIRFIIFAIYIDAPGIFYVYHDSYINNIPVILGIALNYLFITLFVAIVFFLFFRMKSMRLILKHYFKSLLSKIITILFIIAIFLQVAFGTSNLVTLFKDIGLEKELKPYSFLNDRSNAFFDAMNLPLDQNIIVILKGNYILVEDNYYNAYYLLPRKVFVFNDYPFSNYEEFIEENNVSRVFFYNDITNEYEGIIKLNK